MNNKILKSIVVISGFLIAFYGKQITNSIFEIHFESKFYAMLYFYMWWIIAIVLIIGFLYGFKNISKELGLSGGIKTGLLFSLLMVAPMFISSAILGKVSNLLNYSELAHTTIIAGFLEECFFRGFLFGILYRKLGWGFIPASILGGVLFGIGHVYQGSSIIEVAGVFFITSIGAVWFAWLYIEWNENLWVPIFLHTVMNLSWLLFDVSNNALGDLFTNIFRTITIAATILITIFYRNTPQTLKIRRRNLIFNRSL